MEMTKETRDTIITSLYDRCSKGEISRNQREMLIQKTNAMFVVTESSVEPVEHTEVTVESEEMSSKEKYDLFKEAVYDKCAKGDITVEAREELLAKAREKFLTVSE